MLNLTNFKLVLIPLYAMVSNLFMGNILINFFQRESLILDTMNSILFLYLPIVFFSRLGQKKKIKPYVKTPNKTDIFLGVLFVISIAICFIAIQIVYFLKIFSMSDILEHRDSVAKVFQSIVGAVMIAPIFEEFAARKLLFPEVQEKHPRSFILLLTLSFTFSHLLRIIELPIVFPMYLIISLFLNCFYWKNRSFVYNVILHSIYNFTTILVSWYIVDVPVPLYAPILLGTLVISLFVFFVMFHKKAMYKSESQGDFI